MYVGKVHDLETERTGQRIEFQFRETCFLADLESSLFSGILGIKIFIRSLIRFITWEMKGLFSSLLICKPMFELYT